MNIIQLQAALALSVGNEIRDLWQSAVYGGDESAAMLCECGFDNYNKFAADTASKIRIAATMKDNSATGTDDNK